MPRLTFPPTGAVGDFSERRARVKRRNGWVDVDRLDTRADRGPRRAPPIAGVTVDEVVAWVDNDPDRAWQALELEESRPDGPRKTLVAKLEPIAIRPST